MVKRIAWGLLGLILALSMACMGCAGAIPAMEQPDTAYDRHKYIGMSSDSPAHWNSTDWGLYMDMQGGGR